MVAREVAVLHLTWAGGPERPPWLWVEFYRSFEEFLAPAPGDCCP
jgi:hypothetical protein